MSCDAACGNHLRDFVFGGCPYTAQLQIGVHCYERNHIVALVLESALSVFVSSLRRPPHPLAVRTSMHTATHKRVSLLRCWSRKTQGYFRGSRPECRGYVRGRRGRHYRGRSRLVPNWSPCLGAAYGQTRHHLGHPPNQGCDRNWRCPRRLRLRAWVFRTRSGAFQEPYDVFTPPIYITSLSF